MRWLRCGSATLSPLATLYASAAAGIGVTKACPPALGRLVFLSQCTFGPNQDAVNQGYGLSITNTVPVLTARLYGRSTEYGLCRSEQRRCNHARACGRSRTAARAPCRRPRLRAVGAIGGFPQASGTDNGQLIGGERRKRPIIAAPPPGVRRRHADQTPTGSSTNTPTPTRTPTPRREAHADSDSGNTTPTVTPTPLPRHTPAPAVTLPTRP
jgi:hypothetical protein